MTSDDGVAGDRGDARSCFLWRPRRIRRRDTNTVFPCWRARFETVGEFLLCSFFGMVSVVVRGGVREVPLWEVWGRRRQRTEGRCSPTCDRSPRRLGARIFQRRARPAVYGHVTPGETRRWRLLATAAKGSGGGTTVQPFRPYNLRERFPFFFSLRFPHSFPSEIDRAYEAFAAGYILPSSIYSLILFWRLRVRLGPNL